MDAPARKKKPASPGGSAKKREPAVDLPERGPFCSKCQYDYGVLDAADHLQATLAAHSGLVINCPGCGANAKPVLDVKDTHPPPPHGSVKRSPLSPGVKVIIDSVFHVDYERTWKKLHENLVVGEGRTEHGVVVQNLDWAEDNARQAHQLYVNMRLELERFEIDAKIVWAALYDEAYGRLQSEKDSGHRNKTITDGDVEYKVAELHPDEYRAHKIEKKRLELTVKHAENFAEIWSSKCRSLQAILGKIRGGGIA